MEEFELDGAVLPLSFGILGRAVSLQRNHPQSGRGFGLPHTSLGKCQGTYRHLYISCCPRSVDQDSLRSIAAFIPYSKKLSIPAPTPENPG
jgi:hypothetical protein